MCVCNLHIAIHVTHMLGCMGAPLSATVRLITAGTPAAATAAASGVAEALLANGKQLEIAVMQ